MPTATPPRRPLRITHLTLANWRNFRALDVPLQSRLFVVGPNASGKSNLIDAFRFLSDVVNSPHRGGVSMLRCLAARRYPDIELRVVIGSDEQVHEWSYELHIGQDNQRRPIIKREVVRRRSGAPLIDRPDQPDKDDPARLRQTSLEQVNVNKPFREIADFFSTIRYRHIVPQLVREPDRSVGRRNDPYGGDFLEQLARTPEATQQARLRQIRKALAVAVPQLENLELIRDARGTPHLRGKYRHWRPQGHWQSEEHFSDGTLRLMGLLWSVLDGAGPLLLEEPELSLHDEVVRYVPQMFAQVQRRTRRQIIVSTHSRELLGDEGIGLNEVLILQPAVEGTVGQLLSELPRAVSLTEAGLTIPDIVMSETRPPLARQLALFGR